MSGDGRRGASRREFHFADRGRSNSNDHFQDAGNSDPQSVHSLSSLSTAQGRVFSIADSHMTNTDESAHSVEIDTDSVNQVLLRVYHEQATNNRMLLCCRRNVTPNFLRSYSAKLVEDGRRDYINNEDCLVFVVSSGVNTDAFRLMVESIGKVPRVIPSPNNQIADISFSDFFELCVVLWSYVCRIDHWVPVANYIRESHWEDDLMQWPADRLTQWLFIALVFNWPDIFKTASNVLIVSFSDLDAELQKAGHMPREIIKTMTKARQDYMRMAYDEIRSISLSLTCDPRSRLLSLPQDIRVDLSRAPLHLDLLQPLPEDIHKRVSPEDILKKVRKTIKKAHSVPPAQALMQRPTESTIQASTPSSVHSGKRKTAQQTLTENSKTPRTTVGGNRLLDVAIEAWHFGKDARKRRAESKSSSPHPNGQQRPQEPAEPTPLSTQEIDNICEALLHQLEQFSTTRLLPLNVDDFSSLRAQHVLPDLES